MGSGFRRRFAISAFFAAGLSASRAQQAAQGTVLPAQISQDASLDAAHGPYYVTSDVYITATLYVQPGVQILVKPDPGKSQANDAYGLTDNTDIIVYGGALVMQGDAASQQFAVIRSAVEGQMWGGLVLLQPKPGTSISGTYVMGASKGIVVYGGSPEIKSSVIYGNQYGILCLQAGSPQITGCSIASNAVGLAATSPDANPSVQNSQFSQNSYGVYGVAFSGINLAGTAFAGNQYDIINGSQTGVIDGCTANFTDSSGGKVYPQGSPLIKTPLTCAAATPAPTAAPAATAVPTATPKPTPKITVGGALIRGLVPGWGQFWEGRMEKGIIYPSLFITDLGVALAAKGTSNRLYEEYKNLNAAGVSLIPGSPAHQAAQAAVVDKYDEQDEAFQTYQAYGMTAGLLYGYNLVDSVSEAMHKPKAKPAGLGKVALMGLLPGGGHFATGRYLKGGYTAGVEILGIASLMSVRSKELAAWTKYNSINAEWNSSASYQGLTGQAGFDKAKADLITAWFDSHQYASYNNRLVSILVMGHIFQLVDSILDGVHDQAKGGAKASLSPELRVAWTGLEPEYRTGLNIRF